MISGNEFHHIGIACTDFNREQLAFAALGYAAEGPDFEDPIQGIRGRFLTGGGPRLELVSQLARGGVLEDWLKRGVKFYHMAYTVENMDAAIAAALERRGKLIVAPVPAVAFNGRNICFMMMPNMALVEWIER
ncbi:VOC family protein [Govanella unica]|uniref:VOC family protein n=1 Tax=Govanella unica TaxID=2975056 RepID=A0A9X3TVB1_9PROT|nr:VOC family protein [Govania unica]MDA5192508.1 VOC family protein [Govania unica]